jgi:hypothetical protein
VAEKGKQGGSIADRARWLVAKGRRVESQMGILRGIRNGDSGAEVHEVHGTSMSKTHRVHGKRGG